MCPMCPQDLSTIRSQPFAMFRFPKPGLPKLPNPHTSAVGLHPLHEIPFAKISTQLIIPFTRFFPKQFHRKFFPGLSQNIFPANATIAQFAIFQKCRIAPFARFLHPIIQSPPHAADPEKRKLCRPLIKKPT